MKPSPHCYDFIAEQEGLRLNAYQDQAGVWTIGYGTTRFESGAHVKHGDVITKEQARSILVKQVDQFGEAVDKMTSKVTLLQCQFDSLVSFTYNLGEGALQQSSLLIYVLKDPNAHISIEVSKMGEPDVAHAFRTQNIIVVPWVTYLFTKWCKITVIKDGKKVKIFNDGLFKRRIKEAQLYQGK